MTSNPVAEIIARAVFEAYGKPYELGWEQQPDHVKRGWIDKYAHAIIAALEGAGYPIVSRELDPYIRDRALLCWVEDAELLWSDIMDAAPSWAGKEREEKEGTSPS